MNERNPVSFKISPELHARLDECAEQTGIKKTTLMIMCLEALCEAIEANDYKLVVPMEFATKHVAVLRTEGKYAPHRPQHLEMNEAPAKKPKAA